MRLPGLLCSLLLALSGCRIVSSSEVFLPIEGPTFEVVCSYELANCMRFAKQKCGGEYEPITRKNCPACGMQVPPSPEQNARVQMPSYRGTLYFRCLQANPIHSGR